MARSVFLTGFPGFISKQLIRRLLRKDGDLGFQLLVLPAVAKVAEDALAEIDVDFPGVAARSEVLLGDITKGNLGLTDSDYQRVVANTTHIWHLAAIYDLAVAETVARTVNVTGTENVLALAGKCSHLERFDYVSTCYVSGTRTGPVLESELQCGQEFKNHYESTKYLAEVEVRKHMDRLPVAIYRPGIVVGDSKTGYTDKYDGPYFIIRLLMRLPKWVPMVNIGAGAAKPCLVPVDFIVDAMAEIWSRADTLGKTFALADPEPHSARNIVRAILDILGRRAPLGTVPSTLVSSALALSPVRRLVEVPRESVIYFNHDAIYDSRNTQEALADTELRCPDFLAILPTLVQYVEDHPDKTFLDGRRF